MVSTISLCLQGAGLTATGNDQARGVVAEVYFRDACQERGLTVERIPVALDYFADVDVVVTSGAGKHKKAITVQIKAQSRVLS